MKALLIFLAALLVSSTVQAYDVIQVTPRDGDITSEIQAAIDEAGQMNSKVAVVELQNSDYHLYRSSSTHKLYHISNTTSEEENPDQTKHIGLYLKDLENITIDGKGARLIMHGEMTSFALDGCRNVILKNFTITYADPTVVEMTVLEVGDHYMTVRVHPQTQYDIVDGVCTFKGESWSWSKAIAQIYDPERDVTWRSWCPLNDALKVTEREEGVLMFEYDERPDAVPGMVFQLRDSYRDEVCVTYTPEVLIRNNYFSRVPASFEYEPES